MGQLPDWLEEEERLEQVAGARTRTDSESSDLQRNRRLRAAFDFAAVLMVLIFLGLLCWSWNGPSTDADRSGQVEYQNAFYRALDEGSAFAGRPTNGYSPGFVLGTQLPKSSLDPLLLPAEGHSLQTWLADKDLFLLISDHRKEGVSLSPPESGRKMKKAWIKVGDLLAGAPRTIE